MAIETTNIHSGPYTGTGAADQEFAVTFQSAGTDEIAVYLDGELVDTSDWSFDRDADGRGTVVATLTGEVYIFSEPAFTQEVSFQRFGPFFPDDVNPPLDRAAARDQWLKYRLDRLFPEAALIPGAGAGMYFAFDADGNPGFASGTGTDAALRTDLASSGFTLVKYKRAGASTFGRSAKAMEEAGMLGNGLSVMHFINPDFDEAIRADTLTGENLSDSFNAAFADAASAAGNRTVEAPAGHYPVDVSDGGEACLLMPIGANLRMDDQAWLLPAEGDPGNGCTAIIVRGNNRLLVNIDGQALADANTPDQAWLYADASIPNGVRAYSSSNYGLNATNVDISGKFRNLRYMIQTEGAKRWKIHDARFSRSFWSAILMAANTDKHCLHNLVCGNHFEDIGDYGCAFYEVEFNTNGVSAYNSIIGNTGERGNLRTNGHLLGWELGQVALQRHNLIACNTYERGRADLTFCRGLAVMNTSSNGRIIGNIANGAGATSSADEAITLIGSRNIEVSHNTVSAYRGRAVSQEGGSDIDISNNLIEDCGGSGVTAVILLALADSASRISARNNRVVTRTLGYAANIAAIGAVQATGKTVDGLTVTGNEIVLPLDTAVSIVGANDDGLKNVVVTSNICRGDPAGTLSKGPMIQVRYASKVTVSSNYGTEWRFGLDLRDNASQVHRFNEFHGAATLGYGAAIAGSSNIDSDGNVISQTVTARLDGTLPKDLTSAVFGPNDDLFPLVSAADAAAAITAGVSIGMQYRIGSDMRIRDS